MFELGFPCCPLQMTVRDALNSALDEEMAHDEKVGRYSQHQAAGYTLSRCTLARAQLSGGAKRA